MSKLMLGIVCGVSVLFVAAVLPRAQDDGTSGALAPPAGPAAAQDAAPGAPSLIEAPVLLNPPATLAGGASLAVFEIVGSSKLIHVHGPLQAGVAPFKTSIKEADLAPCINGSDQSCLGLLTPDLGGKAYLFIDTLDTWRIATNLAGDGAATLTGVIDGKGGFTMAGTDPDSDNTQIMLTGKVTFAKGTLTPTKLSGKIIAVSMMQGHSGTGKFKSIALPM